MKTIKSMGFKMTFLVSVLTLMSCTVLLITCEMIFGRVSDTMKEIRQEAVLNGYKEEIKSEIQTCMDIAHASNFTGAGGDKQI